MDEKDAKSELNKIIEKYRIKDYNFWKSMVDKKEVITFDFINEKGNWYQVEIHAFYDGERGGPIRIMFEIDDGKGWKAFTPLSDSFIINSNNEFITWSVPWNTESKIPTIIVVLFPIIVALLFFIFFSYILQ